jgi:hypothetical protein
MNKPTKKSHVFIFILIPCVFLTIVAAQEIKPIPKTPLLLKPDLTLQIIAPPRAYPGAQLGKNVSVQVQNLGPGPSAATTVDIVLSKDRIDPKKPAPLQKFGQYLKHIQKKIKGLEPGASITLPLLDQKIPDNIPMGEYFLAAVVDRKNAITETNEKNNLAIHDFLIFAIIESIHQHHGGSPTAELSLNGLGFGSSAGSKQVYVGTNPAGYVHHWSPTMIVVEAPSGIPYGQDYAVTIKIGTTTLSNTFNFLLRMWLDGPDPLQGPPGIAITIYGFHFGNSQGSKVLKLGTQILNVTSWQNYQIQATIPNNATPGTHTLTIWEGTKLISNEHATFTVQ